jgi:cation transport regulator ChaB
MESQPESQRKSERTPGMTSMPESQRESHRVPEVEAKPESERESHRASETETTAKPESQRESHKASETDTTAKPENQTDVRYESIEDLPDSLRSTLPQEAQQAYLEAYQNSWDTYQERQGGELGRAAVAHRDGWNVMSKQYAKHPASGKWYPVDELPDDEEGEADENQGLIGKIKDIF